MHKFRKLFSLFLVLSLMAALCTGIPLSAAAADEGQWDPYIYCFSPNKGVVPEYYEFYAKPAVCNSPHYIASHADAKEDVAYLFNVVNLSAIVWDEASAPEGGYATLNGYCGDRAISIQHNARYRMINLEDAYFCETEIGKDPTSAQGIRAVMYNTWPYVQDVDQIVEAANDYLVERYGDEAVLVQDLSGAELLSASQSAVWHYANHEDFSSPYPYIRTVDFDSWGPNFCQFYYPQMMYLDGFVNIRDKQRDVTATNINGIYEYLINLPGEEALDQLITDDSIGLVNAMTVADKAILVISIDGTVDSNDDLTLTAAWADYSESWRLGSIMEAEVLSDGLYAFTMDAENFRFGEQVQLTLSGSQHVQDICFMEAQPQEGSTSRETSQGLVVYSNDPTPIHARRTADIPNNCTMAMVKEDAASGNPLPGVTFDVYAKLGGQDMKIATATTDAEGRLCVDGMDDGTEYYFVESQALPGYEAESKPVTGGSVTNTMSTGTLTVSKKLINTTDAKPHEQFNFRLTLDLSTAPVSENNLSWLTGEYLSKALESTQDLNWTVSSEGILTAEFTLKADASITVSQLPLGTTYQLEEILTPKDRLVYSVTTKIGDEDAQKSNSAQGIIAAQNAVLFTNTLHKEANPQTGDTLLPVLLLTMALLSAAVLLHRKPQ